MVWLFLLSKRLWSGRDGRSTVFCFLFRCCVTSPAFGCLPPSARPPLQCLITHSLASASQPSSLGTTFPWSTLKKMAKGHSSQSWDSCHEWWVTETGKKSCWHVHLSYFCFFAFSLVIVQAQGQVGHQPPCGASSNSVFPEDYPQVSRNFPRQHWQQSQTKMGPNHNGN